MNNINEKISKMVENEQMPCINARDLKSKADEYNKNYESYWKKLYNVIKEINEKITAEAEQGKYHYKGHIADVNKLGKKKFEQFTDDLIKYYIDRSFEVFFAEQLDRSYKYSIRWGKIPDNNDNNKRCYSLNKTYKELQKTFTNKHIIFTKDQIEIALYGTLEGIVISFYGEVWMTIVCLSPENPYMFVNPNGDFVARATSFKELVDIIYKQFNSMTDDNKISYNLDKTCEELQKIFNNNKNITFRKEEINIERYGFAEGIVIEFYGKIWMNVTCWDSGPEHPYTFVNPYGYLGNHVESFNELVDIISKRFKTITKEQCLDVNQYEYNNIDKTFDYLENFFKDKKVFFSRSTDENKFEYITAAIPYHHRLRIDCCDETKHYSVEDNRDDVPVGDFNTLIKLINIIEAYIID